MDGGEVYLVLSNSRKVFIIGDIHGCFDELMCLLKKANYNSKSHRLILLGDVINKGPHSLKVLSWVRDQKVDSLIGNHELKFIQAIKKGLPLPVALDKLRKDMGESLEDWLNWMDTWPVYIEEEDFLAVHGGVIPGEHPRESKKEYLVNIRYWDGKGVDMKNPSYPAWHDIYTGSKLVVYAHWAQQGLKIKKNSIGIDTGCVYGGQLTGIWLPERQLVQISSLNRFY